jgi:2'-5' RNA ligase
MKTENALGYAFALSLPSPEDARLRQWAHSTSGATWDEAGAHVTVARFTGSLPPAALLPAMHEACAGVGPVSARLRLAVREPYWDKPDAEIVMLVGAAPEDIAGVLGLRERLLTALLPLGVDLFEGGPYVPHVTLTTGLAVEEARRLESAAAELDLSFTANELVYWRGGETAEPDAPADPPWQVVERLLLG